MQLPWQNMIKILLTSRIMFTKIDNLFGCASTKYWGWKNQSVNRNLSFAMIILWTSIWQAWLYGTYGYTKTSFLESLHSNRNDSLWLVSYAWIDNEQPCTLCMDMYKQLAFEWDPCFFFSVHIFGCTDSSRLNLYSHIDGNHYTYTNRFTLNSFVEFLLQFHTGARKWIDSFSAVCSACTCISMKSKLFHNFPLR